MSRNYKIPAILLSLTLASLLSPMMQSTAQGIAIGEWRDHLPYTSTIGVAQSASKIYCATPYSVFVYNKDDNSIERLSKVTGLSDIGVSCIRYHNPSNTLMICYVNGNIDLLHNNTIINMADIERSTIIADKTISDIYFIGDLAYLSCGFGIVVLDVAKREIKDTYLIGTQGSYLDVKDITSDGANLFAATTVGIYSASMSSANLANFNEWSHHTNISVPNETFSQIEFFAGKVYACFNNPAYGSDTIFEYTGSSWQVHTAVDIDGYHSMEATGGNFVLCHNWRISVYDAGWTQLFTLYSYGSGIDPQPRDALIDANNNVWIADKNQGLLKNWSVWNYEHFVPEGPNTVNVNDVDVVKGDVWVAPGGGGYANLWNTDGVFYMSGGQWYVIDRDNTSSLDTIFDIQTIAIDPADNKRVYAGSLGRGVLEFYDGELVSIYDNSNSSLQSSQAWFWVGITDLTFDSDNNLWVTNTFVTKCLSVKMPDGTWQEFDFPAELAQSKKRIGGVVIDKIKQKWIMLGSGEGIIVFNDKNTLTDATDDETRKLSTTPGNGGLPSSEIYSLAVDLDGEVWVGTDKGIAVFYTPENVFGGGDFDAQQIFVQQDGYTQILMETEIVSAIAVDGANRKWIGTQNSGVFLMSEDGTEQIYHFTQDNSPLFSNTISDIAIDEETGEVFFATAKGLVSFRGTATSGSDEFDNVLVYPNPVRPEYEGLIAIKGLVTNANVKITDISGNLIYQTTAEGGQATWDGNNFEGRKARTGVYLVFSSNTDGSKTHVAKILFVN